MHLLQLLRIAALLTVIAWPLSVVAEETSKVIIVAPPQALLEATERALLPWNISVSPISAEETAPNESMPGARDRARALCEQHDARAAVWLTSNRDGEALWLFDQEVDRVVVRKLNVNLPLEDVEAAAVALSIKTLLMHTTAAPREERFGASEQNALGPAPTPSRALWLAESDMAIRYGLGDGRTDARIGLGLFRHVRVLTVGARLTSGPGYSADTPSFQGHFSDWTLSAEGRIARPWLGVQVLGGFALNMHRTKLSGTLSDGGVSVTDSRFNPSVGARFGVRKRIGAARIGLEARTRYLTRRQRYLVSGSPVLKVPTLELDVGVSLSVPL